jgi:ketosteroid isomerase-like protein
MTATGLRAAIARDEDAIRALLDAIRNAHQERNAAVIAAPYAADATICDLAPPLSRRGVDPRQIAAWLDTWDGPVDQEPHERHLAISGDLALWHGLYRLSGTPRSAGHAISIWMRATVCLQRQGGAWRIIHEHTSVPFYMDGSYRAAVDLDPQESEAA